MQQSVVSVITNSLSHQVGSRVSIDQIEWNFPNSFVLKDVYIEDLNQDTMLFMDRTKVTINLWKLLSSQISFRTVQFSGLEANLSMDSMQVPNFQFFVDAFRPDNNDTLSFKWSMDIESVAFNDCRIAYKNPYKNQMIGRLNPNDLYIYEINGCMYVNSFQHDELSVLMDNISFKEQSGFEVDNISAKIKSDNDIIEVNNFLLETPKSQLNVAKFAVYHKQMTAFKDPINLLRGEVSISPSVIHPSDFAVFKPSLENLHQQLQIEGDFYGYLTHLQMDDLSIKYGNASCVSGDLLMSDFFPNSQNVKLNGTLEQISSNSTELQEILRVVLERDIQLPTALDSIGTFSYRGSLIGDLSNMKTEGVVTSNLGFVNTSVAVSSPDLLLNSYKIVGNINTTDCHLDKLFGTSSKLGNVAFKMNVTLDKLSDRNFVLDAEGAIDSICYKNYCYQNVSLKGKFDNNGFDGKLIMSDKNAELSFLGKSDLRKEKPLFHFVSSVNDIDLVKTHLLENAEDAHVSFNVETNFVGKNLDDLEGSFSMDNVVLTQDDKELSISNFSLSATTLSNNEKKLSVYSDYLNGSLSGTYSFSSLYALLYNIAQKYIPSVLKEEKPIVKKEGRSNRFSFNFTVENLEPIHDVYPMPVVVVEEARIQGFLNEEKEKFRVRVDAPRLRKKESYMNDCVLLCENPYDQLRLICRTTYLPKNKMRNPYYLSFNSNAKDNNVNVDFSFSNSVEETYSGKVELNADFKDYVKGEGVTADFHIKPSKVILNDTIWKIKDSKIYLDKKWIKVDSFLFEHGSQFLCVNGVNSSVVSDSINVHFSDLYLGYISDIIANKDISFNGVTAGDVYLFKLFNFPYFKGDLYVYDGALNDCLLGDLSVKSSWKEKEKCIDFYVDLLSMIEGKQDLSKSTLHGGVFLGNDSLFIGGHLKDVDLKFLRKYLNNVLQNNTGTATGDLKAYGKFGNIGLDGTLFVKNMAFNVDFLKTSYVLSDSVKLTPHTIELNQTQLFDTEGHYGIVSGMLLHDAFRNLKYAFNMKCDNMLMMNTKEEDNETFYGKVYAKGEARLSGNQDVANMNLTMRTMPNTLLTIPIEGTTTAKEGNFVTFVQHEDQKTMAEKRRIRREKMRQLSEKKNASHTNIQLTLDMEATPDAQIQLIMDQQQGDVIRGNGTGALRLTYNQKDNNFKMYGGYEIEKGEYLFTIQSVISRKFEIIKGSIVQWSGSPYNADLNIKAKYGLNAPIGDIIEVPKGRNTTAVNCLLNLKGTINSPTIKFDIELPNSDEDVKSRLRTAINTEEAMNRNVASLLAFGHFYTLDKMNSGMVATNDLSSVGFSTLSSQLTSWISKMNQDVNIGLNYRPNATYDGTTSTEFDVALSTQFLNDRLALNGNFGYRDVITEEDNLSNTQIIDVDIEYKLNKSGKLRTKAFNRSNNGYFKQTGYTQGVGIVYREDFDSFSELTRNYWQALKRAFSKKKEDEEENTEDEPASDEKKKKGK